MPMDLMTDSANAGTKRHDGDSWDLASSVGATATAVAARRALASKGPNPLIDDPFAEPLVQRRRRRRLHPDDERRDRGRRGRSGLHPQRLSEGMAVRTRFFDSFFLEAAEAGVRQAVILASGLDTRAYRLQWPAGTVVYEIDQPQVIEFKTRTLAGLGAAHRRPPGGRHRPSRRLAGRVARQRIRPEPANGLDRRRPAGVSTAGRTRPPVRQHHLAQRRRQPSRDRVRPGHPRPHRKAAPRDQRPLAPDGVESQLVRAGLRRRTQRRATYLSDRGWQTTVRSTPELYAENGFEFPAEPSMVAFGDIKYLSATLAR